MTIPVTPFVQSGLDRYSLHSLTSIVVDHRHAHEIDTEGQTLIPPTLAEFAQTLQSDLEESLGLKLPLNFGRVGCKHAISITVDKHNKEFFDAAGRTTSEGYKLTVDQNGILITGASPLGAWWGTRSLIQAAVTNQLRLPYGFAVDAPGWSTRGVMASELLNTSSVQLTNMLTA